MLAISNFVVVVLRFDAHAFEKELDLFTDLSVQSSEKISPVIHGHRLIFFGKDEKFELRAHFDVIDAEFLAGFSQDFFQQVAGVAFIGFSLRRVDVAEHDPLPPHRLALKTLIIPG
jgi:hypothetical protein